MVYWYYSQVGTCTDDNYLVTRFFLLPGVSISLIEQLPACLVKLVAVQISVVHGQPKKNNGQRERKKNITVAPHPGPSVIGTWGRTVRAGRASHGAPGWRERNFYRGSSASVLAPRASLISSTCLALPASPERWESWCEESPLPPRRESCSHRSLLTWPRSSLILSPPGRRPAQGNEEEKR